MTAQPDDIDFDEVRRAIDKWQSSPEGNAYLSVRDLDSAITSLEELCQTREGTRFVRSELGNLQAASIRLRDLIAGCIPITIAAE